MKTNRNEYKNRLNKELEGILSSPELKQDLNQRPNLPPIASEENKPGLNWTVATS